MSPKRHPKRFKSTKDRRRGTDNETSSLVDSLRDSILKTLGYRACFNYPLSYFQLSTFLLTSEPVEPFLLQKEIKELEKSNAIKQKVGKYYLKGNRAVNWDVKAKSSKDLLQEIQPTFDILKVIPWIKLLAVTGSVAAFNAQKNDDIDIFIITKKNRLWLTRLFVSVILKIVGKYRTDKDFAGKVCPNIFIPENKMPWHEGKQNIYVAHEILLMRPIINRNDTYFRFLRSNNWIFDYFGNSKMSFYIKKGPKEKQSKTLDIAEKIAMQLQLKYMKNKKTNEIVNKSIIHFNRYDSTEKVLQNFQNIITS